MIDYSKFENSLRHLQLQYENYRKSEDRADLQTIDKEAIAESVICRFGKCYDSICAALRHYFTAEVGIPDVPNSAKPLFRVAAENHVFPGGIGRWLEYADARVDTSYDCSVDKALIALEMVPSFIEDATALYIFILGCP